MGITSSSVNFAFLNQAINRYCPMPLLLLGIVGNVLNILVFTRPAFRNNICVTYFLGSSLADAIVIIVGLLPRLLNGYGMDVSQTYGVLCKLRFFFTYFGGYVAAWFVSLACVERYLSSSVSAARRQLITMKRAYLSMIIIILMGIVIFGEQFYCIDVNQQLLGAPQSCYQLQQNIYCQIADSILQFLFEIFTPTVMMFVFGLLTLKNVRRKRSRVTPMIIANASTAMTMPSHPSGHPTMRAAQVSSVKATQAAQRRDLQLITMLLVQVVVFIISSFPISVYKLYSVATIYETRTVLRKSIENTTFNICVITLFINNSLTFYIYTLCGSAFRKELLKLLRLA